MNTAARIASQADWIPKANGADRNTASREIPKPLPLSEAAFYGVTGDFVRIVEPHTEADPAALLIHFLVAAGIYLGRTGHGFADGRQHYTNLYAAVVGRTAKARKGTAWAQVRNLFARADPDFVKEHSASGLSSGQGLVWEVRDPISEVQQVKEKGRCVDTETVVTDPGISDKRLLVVEPEFARVLKMTQLEGNILSEVIRELWDAGDSNSLVKSKKARTTGAQIGIIGHITRDELQRTLTATETANGFANRFIWMWAERSKELPFGGSLGPEALDNVCERLKRARADAQQRGRLKFDDEAALQWQSEYHELTREQMGMLGAVLARAEAQVLRLAVTYALLDQATVISAEHLRAALAVWKRSEACTRYIWGEALGDDTADAILSFLRMAGDSGATRTDISRLFNRNKKSDEISRALDVLAAAGLARYVRDTEGRGGSVESWYLATKCTN